MSRMSRMSREELLREFFPPPREKTTFQIEVEVEAGRVANGEMETMRIELKTGELAALPSEWQLICAIEAAWRVADGLDYPLRISDASRLVQNLTEDELLRW